MLIPYQHDQLAYPIGGSLSLFLSFTYLNLMEEYSEAEAYKRLLQITESILNSTQTDANILQKYEKLKAALLAKVTVDPANWQAGYMRKLLQCYKYVTSSVIEAVAEFETQIEEGRERQSYNKKVIGVVKEWELRLEELKAALAEESNQKHKLLMKEEVSALTYYCSELDGKLENLGLLIEVHGKMHEIIYQASRSEQEKNAREEQLIATLRERDLEVKQVRNCRKFIDKHAITAQSYNEFKMWSNKLQTVLFQY